MKRSHIIAIVIIAVAIAALMSSLGESSSYADLSEARAEPGKEFHVVGMLDRSKPVVYEPSIDPGRTHFAINDLKGQPCDVDLSMARPADLDRSERVVLIGSMGTDGTFHAKNMLLKCPSKYNEENKISG